MWRTALSWMLRVIGALNIVPAVVALLFGSLTLGPVSIIDLGWQHAFLSILWGAMFIAMGNLLVRERASPS